MSVPVFIHHEINCGNVKGMGSSNYPLYTLQSAKKYNESVILFGNDENKDWWNDWVNTSDYLDENWKRFENAFVNMAINYSDNYVKAFYKRLFAFNSYAQRHNIEEFIMSDSDVLIYTDVSKDMRLKICDCAAYEKEETDMNIGPIHNNMRWSISLGLSYWKTKIFGDFIAFIIDMYENHIDILQEKYEYHKKYGIDGGVCEMTLMYLWKKKRGDNIKFLNFVKYDKNGILHDAGGHLSDNYYKNEYRYNNILKMKVIKFRNNIPYFVDNNGNYVATGSIHFAGGLKKYMKDIYLHKRVSFFHKCVAVMNYLLDLMMKNSYIRLGGE